MSHGTPEVITGARGPRDEREAIVAAAQAKRIPGPVEIPANEVWFQAKYTRYRVQLTAPADQRLPDGRVLRENPVVAQFEGTMLKLKKDNKKDAKKIELLMAHPRFGTDFVDFSTVLANAKTAERDRATAVLQDPEQRRLIVEALKAEGVDFDLPTPPKSRGQSKKAEAEADSSK